MSSILTSLVDHFRGHSPWAHALIGAAVVGVPLLLYLRHRRRQPRPSPIKKDWKKDVVYLYEFPAAKTIPNISMYCLKVETWLRIAKIPYEYVSAGMSLKSREGQCPFVELNGVEYCDSSLIIRDLASHFRVEEPVGPELEAVGNAFEKMVECNTFWSYAQCRYIENADIMLSERVIGIKIPWFMKWFLLRGMKKAIAKKLDSIGIGKHPREDIMDIGLNDLRGLSVYLGSKAYLLGETITKADCSLFGHLAQIEYIAIPAPHRDLIDGECGNIKQYLDRIKENYWPDWDQVCKDRAWSF